MLPFKSRISGLRGKRVTTRVPRLNVYGRNVHKELKCKLESSECPQGWQEGSAGGPEEGNTNSSEGDENGPLGEVAFELCPAWLVELDKERWRETLGWRDSAGTGSRAST